MSEGFSPLCYAALNAVHEAIEIIGADGRCVFVNDAWQRLSGYTAAEALGHTPRLLRSGLHSEAEYDAAWAMVSAGRLWAGELVSRRKDASLVFCRVDCQPVLAAEGGLTHTVVTRRDLHQAMVSAHEHGGRYAMAVVACRDGLVDWEVGQGRLYASPRARDLLGVDGEPDELGARLMERIDAADAARMTDRMQEFLAGHEALVEFEAGISHPSRGEVSIHARLMVVRSETGEPTRVVGTLTDTTARRLAERRLLHSATHDALTGLANRALFVEHLQAAIGRAQRVEGPSFALLYIDLRRFKSINDGYGHATGDAYLCSVAARLVAAVRPGDAVARLGGDEFGVLLATTPSSAVAHTAAGRILRQLEMPHEIDGRWLPCSVSIGVALGGGTSEVDELVRSADAAMYEARRADAFHVRVATPESSERSKRSARLLDGLRTALDTNALNVVYQPIIDIASLRVVGVEALARWTSAEFGPVSPAEFVPLAEQFQLAGQLGQIVLERTLTDFADWERTGLIGSSFRAHVNASPRELLDARLPAMLTRAFGASGVHPRRLCMEITETALVEHPEVVMESTRRIRELGVTFALDDFGTGYSSLSHLRSFPVSSVKIDRSFVTQLPHDLVTRQIVRGLLAMTDALGLVVVAEGVEGPEHVARLRALGCRFAQGYHYARPMPADALVEWLSKRVN